MNAKQLSREVEGKERSRGRCWRELREGAALPSASLRTLRGRLRVVPQVQRAADTSGTGLQGSRRAALQGPVRAPPGNAAGAGAGCPSSDASPSGQEPGGRPSASRGGQAFPRRRLSFRTCADGKAGTLKSNYIHV